MPWKQGEHVAIIGATGSGKTYLLRKLLEFRKHKIFLATKPDDLFWTHYHKIKTVDKIDPRKHGSYYLIPTFEKQWEEVVTAFMLVWNQKNWTIAVDETYYIQHELKLEKSLIKLLTQGRSMGISVVAGMQRPAFVTRYALSEPMHVFCFRLGDHRDLKAIAEGISSEYAAVIKTLHQYEFAYYNKVKNKIERGKASELARILGYEPSS